MLIYIYIGILHIGRGPPYIVGNAAQTGRKYTPNAKRMSITVKLISDFC